MTFKDTIHFGYLSISSCGSKTEKRILRESKILKMKTTFVTLLILLAYLYAYLILNEEKIDYGNPMVILYLFCIIVSSYIGSVLHFLGLYYIEHSKYQFYLLNEYMETNFNEPDNLNCFDNQVYQNTIFCRLRCCYEHHVILKR